MPLAPLNAPQSVGRRRRPVHCTCAAAVCGRRLRGTSLIQDTTGNCRFHCVLSVCSLFNYERSSAYSHTRTLITEFSLRVIVVNIGKYRIICGLCIKENILGIKAIMYHESACLNLVLNNLIIITHLL